MALAASNLTPWLSLEDAFQRLCEYLEPDEAVQRLYAMPIKKRYANGSERLLSSAEEVGLSWDIDLTTGADCLVVDDRESPMLNLNLRHFSCGLSMLSAS
jgi:hypothetical protein